LFFVRKL